MTCEDALAAFAPAEGRDIAAIHDPRPAVLVGARSATGEVCFATVIWATPVSHVPPLVAFALREKSHTMSILREAGAFSLSFLPANAEGVRLAEFCGGNTGRLVDKGAAVEHALVAVDATAAEGAEDGADSSGEAAGDALVPVALRSYSWEVARVRSIQEAGDHLLVIGEVTRAASRASRDAKGRLAPTDTLLCIQHGTYATAREV